MQTIGTLANNGFTLEDLLHLQKHFVNAEIYDLNQNSLAKADKLSPLGAEVDKLYPKGYDSLTTDI